MYRDMVRIIYLFVLWWNFVFRSDSTAIGVGQSIDEKLRRYDMKLQKNDHDNRTMQTSLSQILKQISRLNSNIQEQNNIIQRQDYKMSTMQDITKQLFEIVRES